MERLIDRAVYRATYWLAVFGGLTLLAITLMSVASITGRNLIFAGLGPVPGDVELVEAGTAVAVFSFLPWCHVRRGHVTVDILLSNAGPRVNFAIDMVANVLLFVAASVIAWRLYYGLLDRIAFRDTSFILAFPLSYPYALGLFGAGVFALTALWSVWRSLREFERGAPLPDPFDQALDHAEGRDAA